MLKTHLKYIRVFFVVFLFIAYCGKAQDTAASTIKLTNYLQLLETQFTVKFSYVNADIDALYVSRGKEQTLTEILNSIQKETQLKISSLNDRYYTIVKSSTVDICASVFDNFAENTLAGTTVEVLGSDVHTVTNSNGEFSLTNVPRKSILRIRYLGYKVKYVEVESLLAKNPCTKLLLAENRQELEEVIVYQFLTTGLSQNSDASIEINTDDFGVLPGLIEPDVLQTIQTLPGVKSIDETVSDINVRGGTNDQNLILWDGIKMYQSGHFFGLISAFNPFLTDKVTLIKNGTSAQYGDGVSSVIQLETKNELEDSFFGGAGFNLVSGDIYGQLPLSPKLNFQFSARRSYTDFLGTPTFTQFSDRVFQDTEITVNNQTTNPDVSRDERFFFYDFSGKLLYNLNPDQKLRISFINLTNSLDFEEINNDTGRGTSSTLNQTNTSFGGRLNSQWTSNFSTRLNLYYTQYNLDALSVFSNGVQELVQNNQVLETAAKLSSAYRLNSQFTWSNGYQFNEVGITNVTDVTLPPFESNIKGVIRTHAVFSEIEYRSLNDKFHLRAGARGNYIENIDTFEELIVEPRFHMDYRLFENITAQLQGEFKSQSTNQIIDLEQNFLGIEKQRWILSDNENLPITQSKQAALAFRYDTNKLYIGLEAFYKNVDGISIATQGFQNQNQFNGEIGSYDIRGLEFLINKKTPRYSTWFSYTYNVNNYTFETITPSRFPNNLDIRHTLTFAGTYNYEGLKIGLGLNYRTGKPFTQPLDGNAGINTTTFPLSINFAAPNSSRLSDFLRLDASLIYSFDLFQNTKATIGVSALNLLDRKNVLDTYFRINDRDEIERVENVSLGFTPNFSFRIFF